MITGLLLTELHLLHSDQATNRSPLTGLMVFRHWSFYKPVAPDGTKSISYRIHFGPLRLDPPVLMIPNGSEKRPDCIIGTLLPGRSQLRRSDLSIEITPNLHQAPLGAACSVKVGSISSRFVHDIQERQAIGITAHIFGEQGHHSYLSDRGGP